MAQANRQQEQQEASRRRRPSPLSLLVLALLQDAPTPVLGDFGQTLADLTASIENASSSAFNSVSQTSSQLLTGFSGILGTKPEESGSETAVVPEATSITATEAPPVSDGGAFGFGSAFCKRNPDTPFICKSVETFVKETLEEPNSCNETDPGCCMESNCLSIPGPMSCSEERGSTMCVGDGVKDTGFPILYGKCMCKVGICNAEGRCADSPPPAVPSAEFLKQANEELLAASTTGAPPVSLVPGSQVTPEQLKAFQAALANVPSYQASDSLASRGASQPQLSRLYEDKAILAAPLIGRKVQPENVSFWLFTFSLLTLLAAAAFIGVTIQMCRRLRRRRSIPQGRLEEAETDHLLLDHRRVSTGEE